MIKNRRVIPPPQTFIPKTVYFGKITLLLSDFLVEPMLEAKSNDYVLSFSGDQPERPFSTA